MNLLWGCNFTSGVSYDGNLFHGGPAGRSPGGGGAGDRRGGATGTLMSRRRINSVAEYYFGFDAAAFLGRAR